MKKGFAQFGSNNSYSENSQPQESSNAKQNDSAKKNQDKPEKTQLKEHLDKNNSCFSTVKRQPSNFLMQNENLLNRSSNLNHNLMSNNINNNFNNSFISNGSFTKFESTQQNYPYFQNGFNQFQDNTYSILFNQFQNNVPQISTNQAMSQQMILQLFQIIQTQAKSLQNLYTKVEKMTEKIYQFGQKMNQMKKPKKQNENQYEQIKPVLNQSMQNIDAKSLIKILFGANKTYNYKLQLNEPLDLPLYRERNFSISLRLIDSEGKTVNNNNKIPLSLAIYSSENPPKFVQKNTAGQRILKGYIEQSLHFGQCRFEKIQIKEVTSHFRNGWVFIVIIPSMTPLGNTNLHQNFIDYQKIEPLVLEKVIVKAKKVKQSNKKTFNKQQFNKQQSQLLEANNSQLLSCQKMSKKQSKISKKHQDQQFQNSLYQDK